MESYVVRIYRRGASSAAQGMVAGTIEEPVSGETFAFRSLRELCSWLREVATPGPRGSAPIARRLPHSRKR
jgi:hypothetical protein